MINLTDTFDVEKRPPDYLFNMMGWWASLTGLLGFTSNLLAIGTFLTVKKVSGSIFSYKIFGLLSFIHDAFSPS